MISNRIWTFGSVLVIVAVIAAGWFLGIAPRLDEAEAANVQRATAEATNAAHAATLATLKEQNSRLGELKEQLEELQLAIPSHADLDSFFSQLDKLASANGVVVSSVSASDPRAFVPEEAGALLELEAPEVAAAQSSVTTDNFLTIPIQVTVQGTYAKALAFIAALQTGDRLFLAFNVSLEEGVLAASGNSSGVVEMTIEGQAYVLRSELDAPAEPTDGTATATEGEPTAQ